MSDVKRTGRDLWTLYGADVVCKPSPKIDCRNQIRRIAEKLERGFGLVQSSRYETGVGAKKLDMLRLIPSSHTEISGPINPIKLLVERPGLERAKINQSVLGGSTDNDPASYPVSIMEGAELMVSWRFMLGEEQENNSEQIYIYTPAHWFEWRFPIAPLPVAAPR